MHHKRQHQVSKYAPTLVASRNTSAHSCGLMCAASDGGTPGRLVLNGIGCPRCSSLSGCMPWGLLPQQQLPPQPTPLSMLITKLAHVGPA